MTTGQEIENQADLLYQLSATLLYTLAFYSIGDQRVAEQMTRDAFIGAFGRLSDKEDAELFQEESCRLLYRYGKKNARTNGCPAPEGTSDGERSEAAHLLNRLPFHERYILLLFCHCRFSVRQISRIVRLPCFLTKRLLCGALHKMAAQRPRQEGCGASS